MQQVQDAPPAPSTAGAPPTTPHEGVSLPRLVIAAAASSAGKTTVTTGLLAALTARGVRAAGFKVGPDFIDPGYHALATGRPGRNLDPVLVGEDRIVPLLLHGCRVPEPAEVALIEGVMGLFDGRLGTDGHGSTAHVATLTGSPILLVVDAAGSSRTAAAAALGLAAFDPAVRIAGVLINRTASPRHGAELSRVFADAGVPVVGVLPRDASVAAPSRHLGLVPAGERAGAAATIAALAAHLGKHVDLDAVLALASDAAPLRATAWDPTAEVRAVPGRPRVAVFGGRAFTFRYPETTELLAAAGCEVVEVDPLLDAALPPQTSALYVGGGFPEVHAPDLSANEPLRAAVAAAVASGVPTVAECAGQLYLGEHLDGHPMVGALPSTARMTPRLTLGYRAAAAPATTLLADAGAAVMGHEFHRTRTSPGRGTAPAWEWDAAAEGFSLDPAGTGTPTLHSSYLHLHWAGTPDAAQRLADAAARFAAARPDAEPNAVGSLLVPEAGHPAAAALPDAGRSDPAPPAVGGIDLHHHGDADVGPGLIDLAVNVQSAGPPPWLAAGIHDATASLGTYPRLDEAREAIAAAHGVPPEMVLPTAGAAEAFSLVARTIQAAHPLVVHPQFTEPEAALRAAGRAVQRWLLPVHAPDVGGAATGAPAAESRPDGARARNDPARARNDGARARNDGPRAGAEPGSRAGYAPALGALPGWADALFVGNPTNPTGWLHARDDLLAAGRGRLLVVDEAFMDAADEAESLIEPTMPGRLVLRSLSKTWGLAGLRVGYVVGDPSLVADLAAAQPPWPVSTPALAAMIAVSSPTARAEASARYRDVRRHREHLVAALEASGFGVVAGHAPFVLVDTAELGPDSVRPALAARGFAVRRGESFPGLGRSWIRVRVPEPQIADAFVAALASLRATAT